jgi:hypothetical protein
MRYIEDPRQERLFDRYHGLFPPLARRILENGWQGTFRLAILEPRGERVAEGRVRGGPGRSDWPSSAASRHLLPGNADEITSRRLGARSRFVVGFWRK